jgi:hypothetical protein
MRNVSHHGMFVCEVCEQELLDEKESETEEGVCRDCIGESDVDDIEENNEDFYPEAPDDVIYDWPEYD